MEISAMDSNMTAVDVFTEVGRLLYDGDDWQSRYAAALGIPSTRMRDIRRGKADLGRGNTILADALRLAERRAAETARARDTLRDWLKQNRATEAR
jgi:hypothetical protein